MICEYGRINFLQYLFEICCCGEQEEGNQAASSNNYTLFRTSLFARATQFTTGTCSRLNKTPLATVLGSAFLSLDQKVQVAEFLIHNLKTKLRQSIGVDFTIKNHFFFN